MASYKCHFTFTYKHDEVIGDITAVAHVPDASDHGSSLAIAIVFHGGGWTLGSANSVPKAQISALLNLNFVVVIPEFRQCPEVSLYEGPMQDALDCLKWCRDTSDKGLAKALAAHIEGNDHGKKVEPQRVVVMGHSSGGHLALTLGNAANPPRAILDFYSPKHFKDVFFSTPLPALSSVPVADISFIASIQKHTTPITTFDAPLFTSDGPNMGTPRTAWQIQKMKDGTHLREVVHHKDDDENSESYDRVDPIVMMKSKNQKWPPTCFIHGTEDVLVPVRVTEYAAEILKDAGVECKVILAEGRQHGFDFVLPEGKEGELTEDWGIVMKGLRFLRDHV